MNDVFVCVKISYFDGESVKTAGFSDRTFLGDASGLEGGLWNKLIPSDADVSWSVQARHAVQDQSDPIDVGSLALLNIGGYFDDWIDYQVSGYDVDIRRANSQTMDWEDMEVVVAARSAGIRFIGRERVVIELESRLAALSGPIKTAIWTEGEAPNPQLEGEAKRLVLGQVFQIEPDLFNPQELIYYCADNQAIVHQVAEGGNPTDTAVDYPNGFQLLQSPSLVITATLSGPENTSPVETDLLSAIGGFNTWVSSEPDGWTVETTSGESSFTENVSGNGADVEVSGTGATDTGSTAPNEAENGPLGIQWQPNAGTLNDAVQADDGDYAYVDDYLSNRSAPLTVSADLDIPNNAVINGVEVTLELEKVSSIGAFEIINLNTPSGSIPLARMVEPSGKQTFTYGGDGDLLGSSFSVTDARDLSVSIYAWTRTRIAADVNLRVHQVAFRVYYSTAEYTARIYTDATYMTPGSRYAVRIAHSSIGDSIRARVSGVDSVSDDIGSADVAFSDFEKRLDGAGETEFQIVPSGSRLAIEFAKGGDTNGTQVINSVSLVQQEVGLTNYAGLVPYVLEQSGFTNAVDLGAIQRHQSEAQNPPLGWLAGDQPADDILALLATSCRGYMWHGRDGKIRSKFLRRPSQLELDPLFDSEGERLTDSAGEPLFATGEQISASIDETQIVGPVDSFSDPAPGLTTRASGAKNWAPIPPDKSAGITSTWTAEDKALVAAEYRYIREADLLDPLFDSDDEPLYDSNGSRLYAR